MDDTSVRNAAAAAAAFSLVRIIQVYRLGVHLEESIPY